MNEEVTHKKIVHNFESVSKTSFICSKIRDIIYLFLQKEKLKQDEIEGQ